jgi:hypothetical protein
MEYVFLVVKKEKKQKSKWILMMYISFKEVVIM